MNGKTIQQIWKDRRWPIRDGIYFADETVALIDIGNPQDITKEAFSATVHSYVKLNTLKEFQEDYKTHLCETFKQEYPDADVTVLCGEGSHGSEGFIATCRISTNNLIWLAYLSESNPFEKASLSNGFVTAVSNHGHKWQFPMEEPETFKINFF